MAYLDGWTRRACVIFQTTTGATKDAEFTIPASWDDFWDTIDTAGAQLRVTKADGVTGVTYQIGTKVSWSKANRLGNIEIEDLVFATGSAGVLWLYYGNATATDGAGSFTATTPTEIFVIVRRPTQPTITAAPAAPGELTPRIRLAKTTSDVRYIAWDITNELAPPVGTAYDGGKFEEPAALDFDVVQSGSPVGTMYTDANVYASEVDGRIYALTLIQAGTDANDYTAVLKVRTTIPDTANTIHRTLEYRALLSVNDPAE